MSGTVRHLGRRTRPARLAGLFREAAAFHAKGKFAEAAGRYSVILSLDPRHFDALHLFGVLRVQQGKFDEAVSLLSRAIVRNPASGPAHNNLGMTLNLAN